MFVKRKLIFFTVVCVVAKIYSCILIDPNYSPDYVYPSYERRTNIRQNFLNKRRQNTASVKRVEFIDTYLSNNSIFIDGIIHKKVDENYTNAALARDFETAFRDLLGTNGVLFTFKRDSYWRTWRKVKYPDGDKIICYRCDSSFNCTDCQYGGYWVIEENPPCPFEIISVISNVEVCVINITNTTNINKSCPSVIPFNDILRMCDNPIETHWRIQKVYNTNVSERYLRILCGWRDFCEISTSYLITPKHVQFRIINSTNHVIYSKIMKNNKTDYVCVVECGYINPKTKTISKTDGPLVIDLINTKNKREDESKRSSTAFDQSTSRTKSKKKTNRDKLIKSINSKETLFNLPVSNNNNINDESYINNYNDENHYLYSTNDNHRHPHDKKNPTCSSMKQPRNDDLSQDIDYRDY